LNPPLTDAEKTDIRRFCGYPAYGAAAASMQNWRFFQAYGLLEFRMTNLSDAELAIARRYLGSLTMLEFAVPRSDQAAVWTRNANEPRDRLRLFTEWCRRLCGFLGVPPGPALVDTGLVLVV